MLRRKQGDPSGGPSRNQQVQRRAPSGRPQIAFRAGAGSGCRSERYAQDAGLLRVRMAAVQLPRAVAVAGVRDQP